MYQKLKSLRFYHLGDEAEELFSATCRLCYKFNGLGESEKAEILYHWAKEQADNSLKYAKNNDESLDDFIDGTTF